MASLKIIRDSERGRGDFGWLKARYTFSFGNYYNPRHSAFGTLCVFNDDAISPSSGFPTHGHENMEIVTIVLQGVLTHKDSLGHEATILPGEVQRMSAGTGIRHSEFNASTSEELKLLQIWITPKNLNVSPGYQQKHFDVRLRKNKWQLLISPKGKDASISINQTVYFSMARIEAGTKLSYSPHMELGSGMHVMALEGKLQVGEDLLNRRDTFQVARAYDCEFVALEPSEVLLIEVTD